MIVVMTMIAAMVLVMIVTVALVMIMNMMTRSRGIIPATVRKAHRSPRHLRHGQDFVYKA